MRKLILLASTLSLVTFSVPQFAGAQSPATVPFAPRSTTIATLMAQVATALPFAFSDRQLGSYNSHVSFEGDDGKEYRFHILQNDDGIYYFHITVSEKSGPYLTTYEIADDNADDRVDRPVLGLTREASQEKYDQGIAALRTQVKTIPYDPR